MPACFQSISMTNQIRCTGSCLLWWVVIWYTQSSLPHFVLMHNSLSNWKGGSKFARKSGAVKFIRWLRKICPGMSNKYYGSQANNDNPILMDPNILFHQTVAPIRAIQSSGLVLVIGATVWWKRSTRAVSRRLTVGHFLASYCLWCIFWFHIHIICHRASCHSVVVVNA